MRRAIAPGAYLAEPLLSPLVVASFAFALHPCKTTLGGWILACLLQAALTVVSIRVLHRSWPRWYTPVVELARAHLLFGCWVWGWVDTRVSWRGKAFRVLSGSRLAPLRERRAGLPAAS